MGLDTLRWGRIVGKKDVFATPLSQAVLEARFAVMRLSTRPRARLWSDLGPNARSVPRRLRARAEKLEEVPDYRW